VLYFSDEMRYGLLSNMRRSWSKVGERSILPQQHGYENHYLFSALSPLTGDSFHLMDIDGMDSASTHLFLSELKKKHPKEHVVVVWDNAPCHRPLWVRNIAGLTTIFLPSYSPELNPAERFFEEIRRATANRIFESLEKQEELITKAINKWMDDTEAMRKLVGYKWIIKQCIEVN
jgi:transposase